MFQRKRMRWPILAVLALILTALSCAQVSPTPVHQITAAPPREGQPAELSRFGVDYVFPNDPAYVQKPYAERFAEAGLQWVNFAEVKWSFLEPEPPVQDEHRYVWNNLDASVLHWQENGFEIVMTLRLGNGWFAGPIKEDTGAEGIPLGIRLSISASDRLPKSEYLDDYQAWLSALVERYDGDGSEDMPGLLRPVLHYQIGNEYGNLAFWTGTVDEYFQLLELASQATYAAEPQAQVIPNGLRMNDVFHKDPDALHEEQTLQSFVATLPEAYQNLVWKSYDLNERTLLLPPGSFDVLDAGSNGSWHTVSQGNYTYVHGLLSRAGNEVPIWDMEARSEPLLMPIENTNIHMDLSIPNGNQIVQMMKNKNGPRHEEAVRWYRAAQARILAKVFVTRFAAGFEKVFMGMPIDWDRGISGLAWPNPYMGLLDPDGNPWPAYDTLQVLIEKLDGFVRAERLPAPEEVSLYRFDFVDGRGPVWVVWLEENAPRGLDDALSQKLVTLENVSIKTATEIPTAGQVKEIPFEQNGEDCSLLVSPTPVILSP